MGGSCSQCAELAEQLNVLTKLNEEMGGIQKRNEQKIADLEWTTVRNRKSSPGGTPIAGYTEEQLKERTDTFAIKANEIFDEKLEN